MTANPAPKIATDAHSGPTRWRKRPVVIDALQYTGDNAQQVIDWITTSSATEGAAVLSNGELMIVTLEDGSLEGSQAKHIASIGDWVIRGLVGEFYACKPDVFGKSYEPDEAAPADFITDCTHDWWTHTGDGLYESRQDSGLFDYTVEDIRKEWGPVKEFWQHPPSSVPADPATAPEVESL